MQRPGMRVRCASSCCSWLRVRSNLAVHGCACMADICSNIVSGIEVGTDICSSIVSVEEAGTERVLHDSSVYVVHALSFFMVEQAI